MEEEQLYKWLALERIPRVGPLTIARLKEAFGDPHNAIGRPAREIRAKAGISEKLAASLAEYKPEHTEISRAIKALRDIGARVVTRWDPEYPSPLLRIYDPPAMLFVRGNTLKDRERALGVVGARNPSQYGLDVTAMFTRDLVRAGFTITSGAAKGVDTAAHRTALAEGGFTIAALGCGIDVVYPRENKGLIEEMAERGAVVSEFRPGTPPLSTNFYRRNRIISGLAQGVLVVEAGLGSGSLITATHALDQNREVFATPGSVLSRRSMGPHSLIKQGAALVESVSDILDSLGGGAKPSAAQLPLFDAPAADKSLSDQSRRVLAALDADPAPLDVICEALGMEVGRLAALLLELELAGYVRRHPGNTYSRTPQ